MLLFKKIYNEPVSLLLLMLTMTLVVIFLNGGIDIGSANHKGLLPVVNRLLDGSYLQGDFGIEMRLHHHRVYALLVAGFVTIFGENSGLYLLKLTQTFLLVISVWMLARTLNLGRPASLLVLIMLATQLAWAGAGLEINTLIGNPEAQPPTLAHALILFSLVFLIREKYALSAFLLGLATLVHTQIGVIFSIIYFPILIYLLVSKPTFRKALTKAIFAYLVPASIALIPVVMAIQQGALSNVGYFEYIRFRMPHHFEIKEAEAIYWHGFHLVLMTLLTIFLIRMNKKASAGFTYLTYVAYFITGLSIAHLVEVHFLEWGAIAKLQFLRVSPFVSLFGAIGIAFILQNVARRLLNDKTRQYSANFLVIFFSALILTTFLARAVDFQPRIAKEKNSPWTEITKWAEENTEPDAIFITPPGNTGFTYLANRSTVVEYKINPDGSRMLDEWLERLKDVSQLSILPDHGNFKKNANSLNQAYSLQSLPQLRQTAGKYNATYAITFRQDSQDIKPLYQNAAYSVIQIN